MLNNFGCQVNVLTPPPRISVRGPVVDTTSSGDSWLVVLVSILCRQNVYEPVLPWPAAVARCITGIGATDGL